VGRQPGSRFGEVLRSAAFIIVGSLVLFGLAALTLGWRVALPPQARTWTLVLHFLLAGLGLGGFVVAAIRSLGFVLRGDNPADAGEPALPGRSHGMRGRAGDPGRQLSLAAFPLLTLGVLLGGVWGLLAFADPVVSLASEMWLLTAWLLGAAYFHATSGWRPLRVTVWLAVVLVMAALAAGVAAVLAASSFLTL
jgi:hypothetical protein